MLDNLQNTVFNVGKNTPGGVVFLGTVFAISENKFATAAHVVGVERKDLVISLNSAETFNGYQEADSRRVSAIPAEVVEYDAIKDIAIIYSKHIHVNKDYDLSGSDNTACGSPVYTLGFPHLDNGRRVLTVQHTRIGARIIINSQGVNTKQIILNKQTRPGQSGAPVFLDGSKQVVGMVLGGYVPNRGGIASVGGIDPQTLHQTTHAISSEYIREMM